MQDKKTDDEILEEVIRNCRAAYGRIKQKLLTLEFKMTGLSEDQKQLLSALIREVLLELAKAQMPEELRGRLGPDLTSRIDKVMTIFLPDEH